MIERFFLNIIGTFSKISAAFLLNFAYFSIFSIIDVDKNPFTIIGVFFISYFVAELFMLFSGKVYESSIMEEVESLIEAAVLDKKERKAFIKKKIKDKHTIQFELYTLLVSFAFIIMFLATAFSGYYEYGWGLGMFYSRELLSSIFIYASMSAILLILTRIIISFQLHKGFSFLKTLSVNAFVLYITLVFYVFSVIDALLVVFG